MVDRPGQPVAQDAALQRPDPLLLPRARRGTKRPFWTPLLAGGSAALGLLGIGLLAGCMKPPVPVQASMDLPVGIVPAGTILTAGRSMTFSPSFGGGPLKAVTWTILEPGGGKVDPSGTYTAPAQAGTYTLQATFEGPSAAKAKASIKVVLPPRSEIAAPPLVMPQAMGQKATIAATPGGTYEWTMTGGFITQGQTTQAVTFQAGTAGKAILTCKATNEAGDSVKSSQEVPIALPVAIAIRPSQVTMTEGRPMKFGFVLQGGTSLRVVWSLGEPGAGSLDQEGRYVAPPVPGLYSVRVASLDDPTAIAIAQVKVVEKPPEDLFASASFQPGAQGLTARVAEVEGMTYAWRIEGGTLTSGATSRVVTFKAGAGPTLVLHCQITNAAGDSYLAMKTLNAR